MSDRLPILDELDACANNQARAAWLLRVPDATIVLYGGEIGGAMTVARFGAGEYFVTLRYALLHRVRDAAGLLPEDQARQLEAVREALSRFSALPGKFVRSDADLAEIHRDLAGTGGADPP